MEVVVGVIEEIDTGTAATRRADTASSMILHDGALAAAASARATTFLGVKGLRLTVRVCTARVGHVPIEAPNLAHGVVECFFNVCP